jgi:hypothetical protein
MASHRSAGAHHGFQPIRQPLRALYQEAQIIPQRFCRCHAFLHLPPRQFSRGA